MTPPVRGAALHFDCHAGIAGDMTVAALVDLGVPESVVRDALAALPLTGYRVGFERVKRGALVGLKFRVTIAPVEDRPDHRDEHHHEIHVHGHPDEHRHEIHVHGHPDEHRHEIHVHGHPDEHRHQHAGMHAHAHTHRGAHPRPPDSIEGGQAHRHYAEIRAMLVAAPLAVGVRARALAIFDRIAAVEARLHGVSVEEVAFHEVGAIDSIVDIVAASAALDWLAPARITSRPVPLGHGSVETAHGRLPIPAPATLELLAGIPVEDGGSATELTTPTGAAILAAAVDEFGPMPPLRVAGVGWGAGERDPPERPNLLRVVAGEPLAATDAAAAAGGGGEACLVLEANLDDMTPELAAPLVGELLAAGARDAWLTPVLMKKGRPGWVVSAIVDAERRAPVEAALFRESTTIGVRRHAVARTVLPRRMVSVATPFGAVQVKVAGDGESENVAPELEDCRRLARERGVPAKRVYAEALAAWFAGRVL